VTINSLIIMNDFIELSELYVGFNSNLLTETRSWDVFDLIHKQYWTAIQHRSTVIERAREPPWSIDAVGTYGIGQIMQSFLELISNCIIMCSLLKIHINGLPLIKRRYTVRTAGIPPSVRKMCPCHMKPITDSSSSCNNMQSKTRLRSRKNLYKYSSKSSLYHDSWNNLIKWLGLDRISVINLGKQT